MSSTPATGFFGHPRGLSTLFFTELWERFGYYGMRALLILFMTAGVEAGGLGLEDSAAYGIYGLYTAAVYLLSLPGGWVADRLLGQQRAVLYGGMVIAAGYLMLAVPDRTVFFSGLVVVAIGTGLLKPNISTIVGQLYTPEDRRRDVVKAAPELFRWRGTRRGLAHFLRLYTGVEPEILEPSLREIANDRMRAFRFTVRVRAPRGSGLSRQLVQSIIEAEKPAFAAANLEWIEER